VSEGYSSNQAPFRQTYGYDEFDNMISRAGSYYWQPYQSETFTYTNNRHNGWSYNADGQVSSNPATPTDDARSSYYDAAGRLSRTIVTATNRTGDYRPSYDGDGKLVYEWAQTTLNGSVAPATSSYIVRSTVLRGEILTRLSQSGNKSYTYVPAQGLLFATQGIDYQGSPYVGWTQRNPLGITETGKGIYDPLGNYIPFQQHDDPRPPAGSYNSSSMSGVAASMTANPFGSDTGCLMDGLPTSCSRIFQAINHNMAQEVIISGTQNPLAVLASHGVNFQTSTQHPSPDRDPELYAIDAVEAVDYVSLGPGGQGGSITNPQNTFATNNPAVIDNKGSGQDCNISVAFTGSSINNMNNGVNYYRGNPGLGFTVNISGLGSGGIAQIAKNAVTPNGHWYLQQWSSAYIENTREGESGPTRYEIKTFLDPTAPGSIFRDGNTNAGWIDHPGPNAANDQGKKLTRHDGKWNFLIKAVNGKKSCEVGFHVVSSLGNDGIFRADWGPGQF
jgi:hypothetical protein